MPASLALLLALGISYGTAGCFALPLSWLKRSAPYKSFWLPLLGSLTAALLLAGRGFSTPPPFSSTTTGALFPSFMGEGTLKALFLFFGLLVVRQQIKTLLDGLIYTVLFGLSFEAFQNTVRLYTLWMESGSLSTVLSWFPDFLGALPLIFLGLGFTLALRHREQKWVWLAVPGGMLIYLTLQWGYHALLSPASLPAGLRVALHGIVLLTLLGLVLWRAQREKRLLRRHLREEVEKGVISPAHYQTACSAYRRFTAIRRSSRWGRGTLTAQFYAALTQLALLKEQSQREGNTPEYQAAITRLRREIARLAPKVEIG